MSTTRYNERFIQVLSLFAINEDAKGQQFKSRAYKKAMETINNFPGNITGIKDIEGLPGIGKSILEKLGNAMTQQGDNKGDNKGQKSEVKKDPAILFTGIYGIGPKKATELVECNITTIAQLRKVQNEVLNDKQIIGLKYYEDVLKRIPRSEIDEYDKVFREKMNELKQIFPKCGYEIVGSYRRGAADSGDIDVIISEYYETFVLLIDRLIKSNVILEVLSRGPSKCLVMAKIPGASAVRRVDFLYSPPNEFAFSILYFTGSKEFNTVMRGRALQYGLTLNEHGFHHMVAGEKGRMVKGPKFAKEFNSEKDIFDHLKMVWKEPQERKDGSCVVGL